MKLINPSRRFFAPSLLWAGLLLASCEARKDPEPAAAAPPKPLVQESVAQVQQAPVESTSSVSAAHIEPAPDYAAREAATMPPPKEETGKLPAPIVRAGPERGMWVWHFECYADAKERDRMIEFSKQHGITRLLVQMHYDKDRAAPDPAKAFVIRAPEALAELVQKAAAAGIVVEALEGDPNWAIKAEQEGFWPKLAAIFAWNELQPAGGKLVGIHLDIEPYTLKQFKSEQKPAVMRDYLDLLTEVRKQTSAQNPPMLLAADIPFWYDSRDEKEPDNHILEYNGKKQFLSRHVQDICDYVAVMSYRQKAIGGNSITSTAEGEIAYAESIGKKAFPSVEMSEISDTPTISFYGTDPSLFRERCGEVFTALSPRKGFGGVMIHHYKSYRTFLETEKPAGPS